jgi:alkanesulfonate monooxygenase SsuD/methylene tetrahydromethanopterin reductase-like flavin-dependent oxidoreductase (luciferase family)
VKLGLWITARFGRGVTFEQHFADMRDQVRVAREGGFAMISGGQHFLGPRLQTMPLLARLAADAGEMEIATSVMLLPLLNPVDVAEQAATMNVIAGGRFILGLGLGHQADERQAFGVAREDVASRFDEAMTVMDLIWAGDGRPFTGRHFSLPALKLSWTIPYPRPRIWIGGSSDRALRRARDYDLPWFPSELGLEDLVARYAAHPPAPVEAGAGRPDLPIGVWVHIAETDEGAWADAARLGQVDPARPGWPPAIIGSPETVIRGIRDYQRRLDPTHLLLRPVVPGMTQAETMGRIELLADRVLPALR